MKINKEKCKGFLDRFEDVEWSASRIGEWYNCQYSWYLTYVEGIRGDNYFSYTGSLVHQIMEDFYNYSLINGWDLPLETVRKTLVKKFISGQLENPHPIPYMMRANEAMLILNRANCGWAFSAKKHRESLLCGGDVKILNSLTNFVPNKEITNVEREIKFDVVGLKFRGFLDVEEGEKWVGDYKSKWDEKYHNQQTLYLAAKQSLGHDVYGYKIIEYKNDFNEVKVFEKNWKHEIRETTAWVERAVEEIRAALVSGKFPITAEDKGGFFCTQLCMKNDCKHSKYKKK